MNPILWRQTFVEGGETPFGLACLRICYACKSESAWSQTSRQSDKVCIVCLSVDGLTPLCNFLISKLSDSCLCKPGSTVQPATAALSCGIRHDAAALPLKAISREGAYYFLIRLVLILRFFATGRFRLFLAGFSLASSSGSSASLIAPRLTSCHSNSASAIPNAVSG
jgi:hypothetical protein